MRPESIIFVPTSRRRTDISVRWSCLRNMICTGRITAVAFIHIRKEWKGDKDGTVMGRQIHERDRSGSL